jgi:hypothetical protein
MMLFSGKLPYFNLPNGNAGEIRCTYGKCCLSKGTLAKDSPVLRLDCWTTAQRLDGLRLTNFSSLNCRFGEIRCVAKSVPPQLQTNAALATWPNVNVGFVPQCVSSCMVQRKASFSNEGLCNHLG